MLQVLTMADEDNHVNKSKFTIPFVCGCRNLGEALRRIAEGAAMIRTKGEAGTGNVVEERRCPWRLRPMTLIPTFRLMTLRLTTHRRHGRPSATRGR